MWFSIKDLIKSYQINPRVKELAIEKKLNDFITTKYPFLRGEKIKVKSLIRGELLISIYSPILKNELRLREIELKESFKGDVVKIRFV